MSGTRRYQDGGRTRLRRLATRAGVLAGLPILTAGLAAGSAAAATGGGQVTNYTGTSINAPAAITAGPNGQQALWFTNVNGEADSPGGSIGEITTAGTVSNFGNSSIDDPTGITAADGALWFTNFAFGTGDSIGELTTSGQFTFYPSTLIDGPEAITLGPDGALWFTNAGNNTIGRISTSGTVSSYSCPGIDDPTSITAGSNGALWFTNNQNDTVGEITTSGTCSNFLLDGNAQNNVDGPYGITAGPDGALWFTVGGGGPYGVGMIGRISTSGSLTYYTSTTANIDSPTGITAGPDGALWFTNFGDGTGDSIGRVTTTGTIYSYTGSGIDGPEGIAAGPDGALWFTNDTGNSIGRTTPPAAQAITITSTPPSPADYGGSYTPAATSSSGLAVAFSIDSASTAGACSINGAGVVSFTGVGTCVIDASQAGDADWLPAPQVQQSLTIGQAPQVITFTSVPPAAPQFGSTYTVTATGGGSGNPVTFSATLGEGSPACTMSGSTVTFIGAGSCVISASQAGNTDYQAGSALQTVAVPQETPVLTWPKPGNITLGTALTSAELDATASAGGAFTYSPPAGTVLSLGTHTLTATFTPANTTNYTSGGTVTTQITVVAPPPPPPGCGVSAARPASSGEHPALC